MDRPYIFCHMPSLFETRGKLAEDRAVGFELMNAEVLNGGTVWLRYQIKRENAGGK